jgi:hypothetical protein
VIVKSEYHFREVGDDFDGCDRCVVPEAFCEERDFQTLCKAGKAGTFSEGVRFTHYEGMLSEFDRLVNGNGRDA